MPRKTKPRKSLFTGPDERYSLAGKRFDKEVQQVLAPLVKKWYRKGYRSKDMLYILNLTGLHVTTPLRRKR